MMKKRLLSALDFSIIPSPPRAAPAHVRLSHFAHECALATRQNDHLLSRTLLHSNAIYSIRHSSFCQVLLCFGIRLVRFGLLCRIDICYTRTHPKKKQSGEIF